MSCGNRRSALMSMVVFIASCSDTPPAPQKAVPKPPAAEAPSPQTTSTTPTTVAPQTIRTSKGTFTVPGKAFADGRDLEASPRLTVMRINVCGMTFHAGSASVRWAMATNWSCWTPNERTMRTDTTSKYGRRVVRAGSPRALCRPNGRRQLGTRCEPRAGSDSSILTVSASKAYHLIRTGRFWGNDLH
jgi:hypothetical protein